MKYLYYGEPFSLPNNHHPLKRSQGFQNLPAPVNYWRIYWQDDVSDATSIMKETTIKVQGVERDVQPVICLLRVKGAITSGHPQWKTVFLVTMQILSAGTMLDDLKRIIRKTSGHLFKKASPSNGPMGWNGFG